jgi:GT2 family glycosyltransferase
VHLVQGPTGPTVTIIIPNFNGRPVLEGCLRSVLELDYPRDRLETIVVDNGSTDGSRELVRRTPRIRLVALSANEGFATAVNVGVRESAGEFVAFVNNDVELSAGWLLKLLTVFLRDPEVAAASGKLLFKHPPGVVNDLGDTVLVNGAGLHRGLGTLENEALEMEYVGAASGAACLVRKSAFFATGGFDDSYFAYFEDVDLGWRFWELGFKVVCDPSAVAYHLWQATSRKFGTALRVYHCAKNSFATFLKNAQSKVLPQAFLLWFLRLLLEVVRSLKRRDPYSALAIVKSLGWCWRNLRVILVKRKLIQARRLVSDADLMRLGVLGSLREGLSEVLRLRKVALDVT